MESFTSPIRGIRTPLRRMGNRFLRMLARLGIPISLSGDEAGLPNLVLASGDQQISGQDVILLSGDQG